MDNASEIATLLHIVEKASAHGANLNNVLGAAHKRLAEINAEMGPAAEPIRVVAGTEEPNPVGPEPNLGEPEAEVDPASEVQPTLVERRV